MFSPAVISGVIFGIEALEVLREPSFTCGRVGAATPREERGAAWPR